MDDKPHILCAQPKIINKSVLASYNPYFEMDNNKNNISNNLL